MAIDPTTYTGDTPSAHGTSFNDGTFAWSDQEAQQGPTGMNMPGADDGVDMGAQHMPNAAQPGGRQMPTEPKPAPKPAPVEEDEPHGYGYGRGY